MKISELSTDKAADVLCDAAQYIGNITADEKLMKSLHREIDPDEKLTRAETIALGADMLAKLVPLFLRTHRADVFGIVAAMQQTTVAKVSKQNIMETMRQIKELSDDKEFMDFFKSFAGQEQNA